MPLISSQKDRVLRAVVKEIEGQQSATDYLSLVSTPPCLISATLTECALYNGCPCGNLGLLYTEGQLCWRQLIVLKSHALFETIYTWCLHWWCSLFVMCAVCVFAIPSVSVR